MRLLNGIMIVVAGLALALLFAGTTAARPPVRTGNSQVAEVEEAAGSLTRDIHALNLLAGLSLAKDQAAKLIPLIEQARALRDRRDQVLLGVAPAGLTALEAVRRDLLEKGSISVESEKRYHGVHGRVIEATDAYSDAMKPLVAGVRSILNENQLALVAEFKPCVIPARSVREPVRVGQATDPDGAARQLDRVRKLSDERYTIVRPRVLKEARKRLSRHESDDVVQNKVAELGRTMDEARQLSDVDYQVQRLNLAARLTIAEPPRRGRALDECLARNLLNPVLLPRLRQQTSAGS